MSATSKMIWIALGQLALLNAFAQPVPVHPGPLGPPRIPLTTSSDRPSWADNAQHYKLTLDYDGKRFKLIKASVGDGTARSYLSEQPDIVVMVMGTEKKILRQFNLRDPLEVRIWDSQPQLHPRTVAIGGRTPERRTPVASTATPLPREHVARRKTVLFDLFIPKLPGAQRVELHKRSAQGPLLGSIPLNKMQ
jgi:hypothetical protein